MNSALKIWWGSCSRQAKQVRQQLNLEVESKSQESQNQHLKAWSNGPGATWYVRTLKLRVTSVVTLGSLVKIFTFLSLPSKYFWVNFESSTSFLRETFSIMSLFISICIPSIMSDVRPVWVAMSCKCPTSRASILKKDTLLETSAIEYCLTKAVPISSCCASSSVSILEKYCTFALCSLCQSYPTIWWFHTILVPKVEGWDPIWFIPGYLIGWFACKHITSKTFINLTFIFQTSQRCIHYLVEGGRSAQNITLPRVKESMFLQLMSNCTVRYNHIQMRRASADARAKISGGGHQQTDKQRRTMLSSLYLV